MSEKNNSESPKKHALEKPALTLLNASQESAILLNCDGSIAILNEIAAQRLGQSIEVLIGQNQFELFPTEVAEKRKAAMDQVIHSGKPFQFEDERSGKHYENKMYPIFNAQNEVVQVAVYGHDVTERKKVELERSFQSAFVNSSIDAITATNLEGNVVVWNPAAEKLLGFNREEMMGASFTKYVPPNLWENRKESLKQLLKGDYIPPFRTQRQHKDGRIIEILFSVSLVKSPEGNIIGYAGINRDLTDQVDRENFLRTILDATPNYIFVRNLKGDYLMANKALADEYGVSVEDIENASMRDVYYRKYNDVRRVEEFLADDREVIETQRAKFIGETPVIQEGKETTWFQATKIPITLQGEHCVLGIVTDVTKDRLVKEELMRAKEQADMANLAKSQFLSRMSHEIRTPLHAILGFGQLLSNQLKTDALSESSSTYVENILVSGQRLLKTVDAVFDISSIESNQIAIKKEPCQLQELVETAFTVNQIAAQGKRLQYQIEYDDLLPDQILTDGGRLSQILIHLLDNAIKFTPEGKLVRLQVNLDSSNILFQVMDQGIGIPLDKQEIVFDFFEQVDGSSTREYEGAGLGLAIAKQLTILLGGTIHVRSNVDEGTTFTIQIPLEKVKEEKPQMDETESEWGGAQFPPGCRILIVEDDEMNRNLLKRLLEKLGITVETAADGQEGMGKTLALKPDLVLMDVRMPVMDGNKATHLIRQHPEGKDIPIIALSGEVLDDEQKLAYDAGVSDYLTKPVKVENLVTVLKKYLKMFE